MVKIYCIEDCNNLKYVGSTKQKLIRRLTKHKCDKKYCSSKKLDLDNCKIYVLEETDEEHRLEREKYWIHKIDCINTIRYDFDAKEYMKQYNKEYNQKNKDKLKEYKKQKYQENKDERLEYQKEYQQKNRDEIKEYMKRYYHYKKSWGGDERSQNNLLLIDVNLFL